MARRRDKAEDPSHPRPRNDAYVGLLAITFLALGGAAGLLYADFDALGGQTAVPARAEVAVAGLPAAGVGTPAAPAETPADAPK